MNTELLKILEKMGYHVLDDNQSIRIFDESMHEFKKNITNGNDKYWDEYEIQLNNNQKLRYNGNNTAFIHVDDNIKILVENWNNAYRDNHVNIYVGKGENYDDYDYALCFTVTENSCALNANGYVSVFMFANPKLADKKLEGIKLKIEDKENMGVIYINNEVIGVIPDNERTAFDYYSIIIQYIYSVMEKNDVQEINENLLKGINLVTPTISSMIRNVIRKRDLDNKKRSGGK